jgi:hypothetical protein
MKAFSKILFVYSLIVTGLLITGFYSTIPCRHAPQIFLEKMNVIYNGVDNPVSIDACGLTSADVTPAISNGTMTPSAKPGSYNIFVSGGTETVLNVSSKDPEKPWLGSYKFRVKRVPDPVAYLGSIKADGIMTKEELQAQSAIFAKMENFDFNIKFTVVSFDMSLFIGGKWSTSKAEGASITPGMKINFEKSLAGDKVLFHNVIAKGPDGTLRRIPGVVITVK